MVGAAGRPDGRRGLRQPGFHRLGAGPVNGLIITANLLTSLAKRLVTRSVWWAVQSYTESCYCQGWRAREERRMILAVSVVGGQPCSRLPGSAFA